ncbi:hypothetical protein PIB30_004969 [Stylosanthes scabra]|uniref:DUF4283 domain-containing protein n=1 Tax=Stylosanthes scabra TaxID=79078 RepID=A0ABU6X3V9_9FABA|nr:hypothetical protein [Stylosanthes scabra]
MKPLAIKQPNHTHIFIQPEAPKRLENNGDERLAHNERGENAGTKELLMVFDSEHNMEEAYDSPLLLNHFLEVNKWTKSDTNNSRKTWIEVIGLPLHGPLVQAFTDVCINNEEFRVFVKEVGETLSGGIEKSRKEENTQKRKEVEVINEGKDIAGSNEGRKNEMCETNGNIAMEVVVAEREESWVGESQQLPASGEDNRRTGDVIKEKENANGPKHIRFFEEGAIVDYEFNKDYSPIAIGSSTQQESDRLSLDVPPGFEKRVKEKECVAEPNMLLDKKKNGTKKKAKKDKKEYIKVEKATIQKDEFIEDEIEDVEEEAWSAWEVGSKSGIIA